jgi:hypothetical protein
MLNLFIFQESLNENRSSDFVAIGSLEHNKNLYHSGLVIQYDGAMYEFHYNCEIEYEPMIESWHYIISKFIVSDEIPSFIAMCQNVKENANPLFGYFYSGESYDVHGNHQSLSDLGERMTCVGFCLNILSGFLEEDYLTYTDWDASSHGDTSYLKEHCTKHNLDITKISGSYRRITPKELLISALSAKLPIRKHDIESVIPSFDDYLSKTMNPHSASES